MMRTYARQPLALESGCGVWVRDTEGREYLDLVGGLAVNVLGHAHPAVRDALASQAARLLHTSNLYFTEQQVQLADRLVATAFPSRVFLCNSGTEANEGAIKLARKWGRVHKNGAGTIICAAGAFHGRTMGSLAATANAHYREPFEPLTPGFRRVAYNDVSALRSAVDETTCAVMLEPIQGESGVRPLGSGVLSAVRDLCDENDLLLILDEVQTGMGRTGSWWAHQHDGVTPDVMTVAKGLAGGVPIGAVLAAPRADVFEPGDHGSTFGGNPLACAAALAVLRTIDEEHLVRHALAAGDHFREALQELGERGAPLSEVRGRGLMLAMGLAVPLARQVTEAALEQGVILNAVGDDTVRLLPPLVITHAEIDEAVRRIGNALSAVAG